MAYIDRNELINNLNKFAPEHYNALINQLIVNQTAADVVEVVRCKNCVFGKADTEGSGSIQCLNRDAPWHKYKEEFVMCQNDYCSYGEHKPQKEG